MASPIQFDPRIGQTGAAAGAQSTKPAAAAESSGPSFRDVLLDSLNQVNRLEQEASQGVERLATGETANMAEVLSAVRKADVAFSLLMEIRNKLMDAYTEIKQIHV
jgi:flagellar hook-basal body complex protein FliE